jgi:hypothetical protein
MNERRKEQRLGADLLVQIKAGKKTISGTVYDASMHGLFVACDEPPGMRQLVQIEVSLPSGSKMTAHTMVVHHGGATKGAGLEFFGKGDRPEWDELIRQLARNPMQHRAPTFSTGGYPSPAMSGGHPPVAMSAPPAPPQPSSPGARPGPPPPPQRSVPSPPGAGGLPQVAVPPAAPSSPGFAAPRISNLPNPPSSLGMHQLTPAGGVQQPPGVAVSASMPPQGPPAQLPPHVLAAARGILRIGAAYGGAERRVAPRVKMQLELRLRTSRSIHVAHTIDISMMGVGVLVADCPAQIGEQVIVNLIQPGTSMSFRRDGTVSRVTTVLGSWLHVAIHFAPVDPMREVLFANFMNTAYAALNPSSG